MTFCEKCGKNEVYHTCPTCNQHLCLTCFNTVHFGINSPRLGRSMVYNRCIFCSDIYVANAKVASAMTVCVSVCVIILTWKSGMNYLAAVNLFSQGKQT